MARFAGKLAVETELVAEISTARRAAPREDVWELYGYAGGHPGVLASETPASIWLTYDSRESVVRGIFFGLVTASMSSWLMRDTTTYCRPGECVERSRAQFNRMWLGAECSASP